MTQTPNQQEIEAFLKGKPISSKFLTQLSTRVEALLKGLEASTQSLTGSGDDFLQRPTEPIVKD
jgi:hypothetical protein